MIRTFCVSLKKNVVNNLSWSLTIASTLLALTPSFCAGAQVLSRINGPIDESTLVVLKGNVHPLANAASDEGPVDGALSGRMLLMLRRSPQQEAALRQLVQEQLTVNSPNFHKWLTPEQFGEQFGVADTDIQTVSSYLSAHGFTVGRVYKNKMAIEVTGTAAQLSETFHTEIHSYSIHGQRYFANATDPSIPAALAPVVRGFASLNNIRENTQVQNTTHSAKATFEPETHRMKPAYTGQTGNTYYYYVAPADVQTIYNIPVTSSSPGAAGAGVSVGVIGDSQINVSLVERYQSISGATGPAPVEIVDGNDPTILTTGTDATIAYEQLELISAAAPAASLYYYTSATTDYDTGLDFAIIRAIEDNAVSVLAFGFQTCEATLTTDLNSFISQSWLQAAAQGMTVVTAAGDSGAAACDAPGSSTTTQGLAVNGYASTPYDTAVGGTDFYYGTHAGTTYWNTTNTATYGSAKGYIPEQPWDDSYTSTDSNAGTSTVYAGGGGFSTIGNVTYNYNGTIASSSYYPIQSWQSGFLPNGTTARAIPDVSFFAGNNYNSAEYAICALPTDCETAGTSLTGVTLTGGTAGAAAIFAGIMADVVEATGSVQGNVNPTLYYLATQYPSTSSTPIFHSTVAGTNSVACSSGTGCSGGYLKTGGNYAYPAVSGYSQGYNLATGLGSINATNLINNWKNPAATPTSTALAITNYATNASVVNTSVVHGTPLNFTATVTGSGGTPTGDVAFSDGSMLPGETGLITVPLASGVAKSTYNYFLPGGSYNVTARYAGDSTFEPSSTTQPIIITPEASRILIYSTSPATGTSVPFGTLVKVTSEPFSLTNSNVSVPTGTMSVFNNGSDYPFLLMPLSSEGTATFSSTLLPASTTYNLYFSFSGDPSYQPSTSQSSLYTVTVTQATPTITLSPSSTTASTNVPITLTATLQATAGTPAASTGVAPTGTVTFSTSSTPVALTPGFNSAGQAISTATIQITASQLASSGTALSAIYSGDSNYAAVGVAVAYSSTTPAGTATSFTLTPNATTVAENGTLTLTGAASTAASAGACTVTYTVNDQYQNEFTGTLTIKNTGTTAVNNFALTWTYANGQVMQFFYNGVFTQTGANVTVSGNPNFANTTLAAGATFTSQFMTSWNNVTNTNPTAFALNGVPCNNSTSVPGTVQLYANGSILTGDSFAINNSGTGTYTIPLTGGYLPFASGKVVITGVFTPTSSSYSPSSATTTETVTDDRTTADFSISTDTLDKTISPSSSNVFFQVQLTSLQNFAGSSTPIALSCSVPSGSNLKCTLGTTSTTIGTSGIVITSLEVSGYPTVNNGALKPAPVPQDHWWLLGGGTTLACIFLFGIPARRKGWQGIITVLVCTVLVSSSVLGCGSNAAVSRVTQTILPGSSGSSAHPNATGGGIATNDVAPGTYQVVITGTATTNTALVHNTVVTVVVTATPTLQNGTYTMTNLSSALLMTDTNDSGTSGTQVEQFTANNTSDQQWIFSYQGNGLYTIQSAANPNLYITDPGDADTTSPVVVATLTPLNLNDVGSQLWTFNLLEGGYQIVNYNSSGVLDDDAFGATNGTPVLVYPEKSVVDADNQTWYIH
jgi:hypothetical protein